MPSFKLKYNPFTRTFDYVNANNAASGVGYSGTANNYSALPDVTTSNGQYWFVLNSQGTKYLPGTLGGTYYPNGTYYSNGTTWITGVSPWQATQSDVNAGVITDQFVSPNTLASATTIITSSLTSGYIIVGNGSNIASKVVLTLNSSSGSFGISNTGVLTFPDASGTTRGLLNSTDWGTFNSKVSSQWITNGSDIYYNTGGVMIGSTGNAAAKLHTVDTGTGSPRGIILDQYNTSTNSSQVNMRKARGTFASPTTIVTGDILSNLNSWGYDGTSFINSAAIRVTSVGTIGTSRIPTKMDFYTMTDITTGVLTLAMTIDQSQNISFANMTSGSVLFSGSSGLLSQNNSNFYFSNSSKFLAINHNGDIANDTDPYNGYGEYDAYNLTSNINQGFSISQSSGVVGTITEVPNGTQVGLGVSWYPYNGTTYAANARILSNVRGTTSGNRGGDLVFQTKIDGGALTNAITISNTQVVSILASTASTTTSTGALVVTGGVGIAGDIFGGATANFTSLKLLDSTYKIGLDVSASNTLRVGNGFGTVSLVGTTLSLGVTGGSYSITAPSGIIPTFTTNAANASTLLISRPNITNSNGNYTGLVIGGFNFTNSGATTNTLSVLSLTPTINITGTTSSIVAFVDINPASVTVAANTNLYGVRSRLNTAASGIVYNIYADGTAPNGFGGDDKLLTAGNGYYVKEGSNATMGSGTLVSGTLTVNTTKVTANSRIFIGDAGGGVLANAGALYEDSSSRVVGTSFTVKSLNALDTSKFVWIIFEPS